MGTPTYIPQNDPHDTLIILNMHKWAKIFFKKNLPINSGSHQPRSHPEVGSGSKSFFYAFQPFLNSPQNSEYFEYRHIRSNRKISPCRMPKTKSPAPLAPTKPIVLYNHFGVCRGGGGGTAPGLWGRVLTRSSPNASTLAQMKALQDKPMGWGPRTHCQSSNAHL